MPNPFSFAPDDEPRPPRNISGTTAADQNRKGTEKNGTKEIVKSYASTSNQVTVNSSTSHPPIVPPLSKSGGKLEYPAEFEEAWRCYPKRFGGNPKRPAYMAWRARIRDGATPEDLIAGVERYTAFCESENKIGTRYVLMARTFFGPSEWWAEEWMTEEEQEHPSSRFWNDEFSCWYISAYDPAQGCEIAVPDWDSMTGEERMQVSTRIRTIQQQRDLADMERFRALVGKGLMGAGGNGATQAN